MPEPPVHGPLISPQEPWRLPFSGREAGHGAMDPRAHSGTTALRNAINHPILYRVQEKVLHIRESLLQGGWGTPRHIRPPGEVPRT
jgi:hypothetical protein